MELLPNGGKKNEKVVFGFLSLCFYARGRFPFERFREIEEGDEKETDSCCQGASPCSNGKAFDGYTDRKLRVC